MLQHLVRQRLEPLGSVTGFVTSRERSVLNRLLGGRTSAVPSNHAIPSITKESQSRLKSDLDS